MVSPNLMPFISFTRLKSFVRISQSLQFAMAEQTGAKLILLLAHWPKLATFNFLLKEFP